MAIVPIFVPTLFQNSGTLDSNPAQSLDPWRGYKSHLNLAVSEYPVSPICANPPPASLSTCADRISATVSDRYPYSNERTGGPADGMNYIRNSVIRGKLIVIPIENSFPHVFPLYLKAEGTSFPQPKRVIVATGDKVVMEPTLDAALTSLFGTAPPQSGSFPGQQALAQAPLSKATRDQATAQLADAKKDSMPLNSFWLIQHNRLGARGDIPMKPDRSRIPASLPDGLANCITNCGSLSEFATTGPRRARCVSGSFGLSLTRGRSKACASILRSLVAEHSRESTPATEAFRRVR